MLHIIILLAAILAAMILGFAAFKPATFRYQRSLLIKAPAEKIFAILVDLHHWKTWSPYEKMDPAMKQTHSGAETGKGAVYEWDGNNKVGQGRMEIMEITEPTRIIMKLDFFRPFKAQNIAEFLLEPKDAATKVTWAMYGPSPYMARVMSFFINCDKIVGKQFDEGLANLARVINKS